MRLPLGARSVVMVVVLPGREIFRLFSSPTWMGIVVMENDDDDDDDDRSPPIVGGGESDENKGLVSESGGGEAVGIRAVPSFGDANDKEGEAGDGCSGKGPVAEGVVVSIFLHGGGAADEGERGGASSGDGVVRRAFRSGGRTPPDAAFPFPSMAFPSSFAQAFRSARGGRRERDSSPS